MPTGKLLHPPAGARWLRALVGPASPTAQLYMGYPCANELASGQITQLAPTVFKAGDTAIVIRHTLGLKEPMAYNRMIYLMDDDWRAGLAERLLPASFRIKLALVEARDARRLEPRADIIVTSSTTLAQSYIARYPSKIVQKLDPVWPPVSSRQHQDGSAPVRLAYLGAWSHRKDFAVIASVLRDVLEQHPNAHLTLPAQIKPDDRLAGHPRVSLLPAQSWNSYSVWLETQSFNIGLYPLSDSRFSAARSINKLLEYTRTGAAVIASDLWSEARQTAWTDALRLTENTARAWHAALDDMIANPALRRAQVLRARNAIEKADASAKAAHFWHNALRLVDTTVTAATPEKI